MLATARCSYATAGYREVCPDLISRTSDHQSVVAEARSAFQFLERRGATIQAEDRPDRTILAYVENPLTYEVELDWREGAAFLLVAQTVNGDRPGGYYTDEGRRVRVHLLEALRKAGVSSPENERCLEAVTALSGREAMISQLTTLSSLLQNELGALTENSKRIFG